MNTVQELLKPRYKVVSDWPGRKDFEVGETITLDKEFSPEYKMYEVEDCQGKRQYITSFFEMFPLQFKRLQWWEERDKYTEMPKYARFTVDLWQFKKDEVVPVFNWYDYPNACIYHNHYSPEMLQPATEADYNQYLNNLK